MDMKETVAAKRAAIKLIKDMTKFTSKSPFKSQVVAASLDPKKLLAYLLKGRDYFISMCDLLVELEPALDDAIFTLETITYKDKSKNA